MTLLRHRAFTLVEVSVATAIFAVVGLIAYGVGSEGLYAFSRNISINRSYTDARRALDRIGSSLQTAGYAPPQFVDATGADDNIDNPAAGIRFWRASDTPNYNITTPLLTTSSLVLDLHQPGVTSNPLIQPPPVTGDLITVPALHFSAKATSVIVAGTTATVTFAGTLATDSNPLLTTVPTTASVTTYTTTTGAPIPLPLPTPQQVSLQYTCTVWHPVAFIAVGTQLRYYPTFISGTTALNTAANYRVLTNLVSLVGGQPPPLPFSVNAFASTSINIDLYAEAPDYNNRNLGSANTYTYLGSAYSARNPFQVSAAP